MHFMGPVARKLPLLWPSVLCSQLEHLMQTASALALVSLSPMFRARKVGHEERKVDSIFTVGFAAISSQVLS